MIKKVYYLIFLQINSSFEKTKYRFVSAILFNERMEENREQ